MQHDATSIRPNEQLQDFVTFYMLEYTFYLCANQSKRHTFGGFAHAGDGVLTLSAGQEKPVRFV